MQGKNQVRNQKKASQRSERQSRNEMSIDTKKVDTKKVDAKKVDTKKVDTKKVDTKNIAQNVAAIKFITIIVLIIGMLMFVEERSLQETIKVNDVKISQLQEEYEREQARTQEIEELKNYMQSDEYIEKYAKEKIGLLKENEILFKENK